MGDQQGPRGGTEAPPKRWVPLKPAWGQQQAMGQRDAELGEGTLKRRQRTGNWNPKEAPSRPVQGHLGGGPLTLAFVAEAGPPFAAVAVEVAATISGAAGSRGSRRRCGWGQIGRPAQVAHTGEVGGAAAHTVAAVLQAPEGTWQGWGKGWAGSDSPRHPCHPTPLHHLHGNTIASYCPLVQDHMGGPVSKVTPSHVVPSVSIVTTLSPLVICSL